MQLKKVTLKPKKAVAIARKHPWVFSGAIQRMESKITEGEAVEIYSHKDEYLATGHYQKGSIAIRIFSFNKIDPTVAFWTQKLEQAYLLRKKLSLKQTDTFRLVHGEGDGFPGLIIDVYGKTAVLQAHSIGMYRIRMKLVEALKNVLGTDLQTIYDKSEKTLPAKAKIKVSNGYLFGEKNEQIVLENGHSFWVDWEQGQKTGFFIDQRNNRQLLTHFAINKKILNTFCYSGGFSIYALGTGAKLVHSVDSSQKAIDWTDKNVLLNFKETPEIQERHESFCSDIFTFLQQTKEQYEVIILDPPAFAKHKAARHNAVQAYRRLNAKALQLLPKGGILFTFSCSQVISRQLFYDTITAAAIDTGRNIRVLHHLSQAPDHPTNIYHPEGAYLKGLVLYVE